MNDMIVNSVVISAKEYERLRSQDARVAVLSAELCAVRSELAEAHAQAHPIASRQNGVRPFAQPVTFLSGPHSRGVVCTNCGMDCWLMDNFDSPMCGSCGLYVESGVKVLRVTPP